MRRCTYGEDRLNPPSNSVVEDCDGLIQEDQAHNAMSALTDLVAKLS
jgi:hypothetical protein